MSYLGKISALVTVNTGDFAPKLNAAAKEVAGFARSVERNIGSSMQQATRSLDSIYTPLQRFERSLRAASSMKLSFSGFAGAIKDIDTLKQRLTSLNQRQIDVILKTAGLKDVKTFREAITGLRSKEFELIARVGGTEKLAKLRTDILNASGEFSVVANVNEAAARVDSLSKQLSELRTAGRSVAVTVDASRVDAATAALERARKARADFILEKADGRAITPSAFNAELQNKRVTAEQSLDDLQARQATRSSLLETATDATRPNILANNKDQSKAIKAKQKEIAELSATINELGRLQKLAVANQKAVDAAASGSTQSNAPVIKAVKAQRDAAKAEYEKFLGEAQQKINSSLGTSLDKNQVASLLKGKANDIDAAIASGRKLEEVLGRAGVAGGEAAALIQRVFTNLGASDAKATIARMQQLASAAEGLGKPFAAARDKIIASGRGIEAAYMPALTATQAGIQAVTDAIKKSDGSASSVKKIEAAYRAAEGQIRRTQIAASQFSEVGGKVQSLKTGREIAFANPRLSAALDRGVAIGNRAAQLPASALVGDKNISDLLIKINAFSQKAAQAFAKLRSDQDNFLPTDEAEANLNRVLQKLGAVQEQAERAIEIKLSTERAAAEARKLAEAIQLARKQAAFVISGRPQTVEQGFGVQAQQEGEIANLSRSQRRGFGGLLYRAAVARSEAAAAPNDVAKAQAYLAILAEIDARLQKTRRLNVQTDDAKKAAEDIGRKYKDIASSVMPSTGMDKLRDSARSAAEAVAKVSDATVKARLQSQLTSIGGDVESTGRIRGRRERNSRAAELAGRLDVVAGVAGRQVASEETARATDDELRDLRNVWAQSVRGLPETRAQLDGFFNKVVGDIGRFKNAADRVSFDPMIAEIVSLRQAGAPISEITQKLLAMEGAVSVVNRADGLAARVGKLSPGATRSELLGEIEQARSSATSNIPLAEPVDLSRVERRISAEEAVGQDFADPRRAVASMQGDVSSLATQLSQLPQPVQDKLAPAFRQVRAEVVRLAAEADPLPEDIERTAAAAKQLGRDVRAAGDSFGYLKMFGGEGSEGVLKGLNARAVRGLIAEMEILQSEMGKVENAGRRAAAAAAFQNLRDVVAQVDADNQIGTPEGDAKIAAARTQAAQAATGDRRRGRRLEERMRRAGDISRGGADNASLALNQLAFAVDDFMSSTGGLEFKLRAISNNITQMAFILGGTTGLFVGLGAVIAGQAAVGLMKWINNGRTAEDQTKAFNESLARQKSLVEELAQAFESLGESVSQGTRSAAGERAANFERQVDDIRTKQREVRESAALDLDPEVQRERANQNRLRRDLESETDIGSRTAIQSQIRASRDRERQRAGVVLGSRPSAEDVVRSIEEARRVAEFDRRRRTNADPRQFAPEEIERRRKEAVAGIDVAAPQNDPESLLAQRRALERQIADLTDDAAGSGPEAKRAAEQRNRLETLLASLELPLRKAADDLAVELVRESQKAANEIASAQNDVADAIRRGVPTALGFQAELDRLAGELVAANVSLAAAQEIEPVDQKEAAIARAEERVAVVRGQRENVIQMGREARLGRGFGGERLTNAISAIQGNERFSNQQAGIIAQARGTADAEAVARQRLEFAAGDQAAADDRVARARERLGQAQAAGDVGGQQAAQADLEKAKEDAEAAKAARGRAEADVTVAQRASDFAASILEFALSVEQAISRIRKIGDSAIQTSERGADAAQQAYTDNPFRVGAMEARDAAERRLIDDRAAVERAQNAVSRARDEATMTPEMQKLRQEREALQSSIKDREAAVAQGTAAPEDAKKLEADRNRLVEIQRQEEREMQRLTEARRRELDAINSNIAAREKELDRSRQRDAEDPTINRQRRRIDAAMAASEQQADEAQQAFDANPTQANRQRRDRADARVRQDRERAQTLQDDLDRKREQLERDDPELRRLRENAADRAADRAAIRDRAIKENRPLTAVEEAWIATLDSAEAEARREGEDFVAQGTQPERDAIDKFNRGLTQRQQADRGRDLGLTERERFRKEMEQGVGADIRARASQIKAEGGDPEAYMNRATAEQAKQIAPMFEEFRMERETAMLQGPSRAALQISDVTTTQGQTELNRLLRGDDESKNVNLAELRKQSSQLDELIKVVRENPLPVWEG